MTQGHEQWCGDGLGEWEVLGGGVQRGKIGATVMVKSIKIIKNKNKINENYDSNYH